MRSGIFVVLALLSGAAAARAQEDAPALDEKNLKGWLEFILPNGEEAKWERLGWRPELGAAAAEAKALQRPILLWAMNGHPCGLT